MDKYTAVVALDPARLLIAVMKTLAGDSSISFEGNLSRCKLHGLLGASGAETGILKRSTYWPKQDFVVLPLEAGTIQPILDRVLPEDRFLHDIDHIQIEKNGTLAFGSYDAFHPRCVGVGEAVPEDVITDLLAREVLAYPGPEDGEEVGISCCGCAPPLARFLGAIIEAREARDAAEAGTGS